MTEELTAKKATMFELPKRIVKIKLIEGKGADWLPEGSDGKDLYTGAKMTVLTPLSAHNGYPICPLSQDEIAAYYKNGWLGVREGDFDVYKLPKNRDDKSFSWASFKVEIPKGGLILNTADPLDYIKLAVLKANIKTGRIAPSWKERYDNPGYKFAIVDEDMDIVEGNKSREFKKEAYIAYGALQSSDRLMKYALRLYSKEKVPVGAAAEFIMNELGKVVDADPEGFLKVIKDPLFEFRGFVRDAIQVKAIIQKAINRYVLPEREDLEYTLEGLQEELDPDGPNQMTFLKIQKQIENAKL